MGLVFEVGDNVEVAFGVGEEFGVFGVVSEVGVFGVDESVELGFTSDGSGVDGGVPAVDGGGVAGGSVGWWHGRSLLLGGVVVVMNPTKNGVWRGARFWFLYMRYCEEASFVPTLVYELFSIIVTTKFCVQHVFE